MTPEQFAALIVELRTIGRLVCASVLASSTETPTQTANDLAGVVENVLLNAEWQDKIDSWHNSIAQTIKPPVVAASVDPAKVVDTVAGVVGTVAGILPPIK